MKKRIEKGKVSLHICTGRISKKDMFTGIDISQFEFINASHPEDEYKEKHYTLAGSCEQFMDICTVSRKLNEMSGNRINWALIITCDGSTHLVATNGTHLK